MAIQDKIRMLREFNQWTQDDMADKMGMSKNGYGKIERGESRMSLDKLEKIAQIFNIDIVELINQNEKGLICLIAEHNGTGNNANYYSSDSVIQENQKLKLELHYKDELLKQQTREIENLQLLVETLKTK